jgi:hypothetical protein
MRVAHSPVLGSPVSGFSAELRLLGVQALEGLEVQSLRLSTKAHCDALATQEEFMPNFSEFDR